MATLESPEDLKNYCLRKLGAPVINIELDDTQIYDRIDDAVDKFVLQHYNGTTEVYKVHTITAKEVSKGYIMPARTMVSILSVMDAGGEGSGSSVEEFERLDFRIAQTDMFSSMGSMATGEYVMKMQHINMFKQIFSPTRSFQYNPIKKYLMVCDTLIAGNKIILHGYENLDAEVDVLVYNDIWMKKYTTALMKQQWGTNVKKYNGVQLPGSITLNGQVIYDEATAEIEKLEEEFSLKYELPVDMFFGASFF